MMATIPELLPAIAADDDDHSNPLTETERRNIAAFEGVLPHWDSHNIPEILTYYDENIVWHNVPMQEIYRGRDEVRVFLEDLFGALPDLTLEVPLRIPRGKFVAEKLVIRGTHMGNLLGLPPTGRYVEIPAISMVEFHNGRLKEDHFYYDAAHIMRQMGFLPGFEWARSRSGRMVMGLAARTRGKFQGPRKPLVT
jgi:steroid delta-isomerase-like uncharacterized protein